MVLLVVVVALMINLPMIDGWMKSAALATASTSSGP